MKLSMQQRMVMNLAAQPEGMNRYDVDGSGLRTLRSLISRGLIDRDGRIFRLTEAGQKAREGWTK